MGARGPNNFGIGVLPFFSGLNFKWRWSLLWVFEIAFDKGGQADVVVSQFLFVRQLVNRGQVVDGVPGRKKR